jgi:hypothetical protein
MRGRNARTAIAKGSVVVQQRTAIIAAMLALGLADAGIANAQSVYIGPRVTIGPEVYAPGPYDPGPRAYDPALPPYEIMRIVRSSGLAPLTRPVRRGAYYVVLAGTRSGGQMRVLVDAYGGDIVKVNPMVAAGPYGPRFAAPYEQQPRPLDPYEPAPRLASPYDPPPRIATVPPEIKDPPPGSLPPSARFDDGMAPVPPRTVPGGRVAAAPYAAATPRTPPAPVARTPMPRPRPSLAARETPAEPTAAAVSPPAAAPVSTPAAAASPTAQAPAAAPMVPVAPLE